MIKIPPAILSDGLAELHLNQLINMENLLAHIVNRHGQNFLSVTEGVASSNTWCRPSGSFFRVRENRTAIWLPIWPTNAPVAPYEGAHNAYYVKS